MEQGIVLVFTGSGKGKTTAAMGTAIRSAGCGRRVCIIQFLKSEDMESGEREFLKNVNIEFHTMGIGYTWTKKPQEQIKAIKNAWDLSQDKISSGRYDLIILDEINNIFGITGFDISEAITEKQLTDVIKNRPLGLDIILTGRNAPQSIIDIADTVTEMKEIKHAFKKGIDAKKGIEY